jgi:hypothetical protein
MPQPNHRRHNLLKHEHNASEIIYDNTVSGLTADDVQAAIDELKTLVGTGGGGGGGYPPQLAYSGII